MDGGSIVIVNAAASVLVYERDESPVVIVREDAPLLVLAGGSQGPPGAAGEQGPPGADGNGNIQINFAFGDATPVNLGAVTGLVVAVSLIVEDGFNGTGAALAVGTLSSPELLMQVAQNSPSEPARYEANPGERLAGESIYLFITPGTGASQGAGTLYMEIAT